MSKNRFVSHFLPFHINTTIFILADVGYFGCQNFTFYRISGHFRSIRNFIFFLIFCTKWLPAAILDVRKSLSVAFLPISDQYATFIFIFFTKWLPSAILDVRNSIWITFLAILDQYRFFDFFLIFLQNGCRWHF